MTHLSLRLRIYITVVLCALLASLPIYFLSELSIIQCCALTIGLMAVSLFTARIFLKDYKAGIDALETGLLNIKDGEYSTTLAYQGKDEFADLCRLYNETVEKLRIEKHWLFQRELLLDKVTQSSPSVLLLINDQQQIVFSNIAARDFFANHRSLEGQSFTELIEMAPTGFHAVAYQTSDGLFSIQTKDGEQQTWHLSNGQFRLNNQPHRLIILKQLTRELSRQEVAVWKKVIRIISHELNNSLGPISSMLHSGKILSKSSEDDRLQRVFSTIEERIHHLSDFVQGYGKFAKLPEPKLKEIELTPFLDKLREQWHFDTEGSENGKYLLADPIQLEQLIINLLKNAHESGSPSQAVELLVLDENKHTVIEVNDRGTGMSDTVMNSALIPFYSTKSTGSGIGLALCREIIDAHHGQITLKNRLNGGLSVRLIFPINSDIRTRTG
ncbi:MAG: ATP-binding protein [Pseudomonadota bacterium]